MKNVNANGYVYRWDNLISGKSYIGSHNGRKKDYIGSGRAFKAAWKKYDEDCWVRTILYRGPEFRQKETEWIERSNALHSTLYYNLMHWTEGHCEQSAETRLKVSKKLKGKPFTIQRRRNISVGGEGNSNAKGKRPQVQCPHCGKVGGINGLKRYHFDKCKQAHPAPDVVPII